jgi:hypothetical protein
MNTKIFACSKTLPNLFASNSDYMFTHDVTGAPYDHRHAVIIRLLYMTYYIHTNQSERIFI